MKEAKIGRVFIEDVDAGRSKDREVHCWTCSNKLNALRSALDVICASLVKRDYMP